jgi:hypothetical protein
MVVNPEKTGAVAIFEPRSKKGTALKRRPGHQSAVFSKKIVSTIALSCSGVIEFVDDGERLVRAGDDVHVAFPGDGFGFGMSNRAIV